MSITADAPRKNVLQRVWSVFDPNERYLRSIQPLVDEISALEPEFERLSQQDLQDRLRQIRSEVLAARQATEAAHALLPPAGDSDTRRRREKEIVEAEKAILDQRLSIVFAAVREAAKRTLSMRHFDVQLLGGIVLHEGRIAEMKTGEGKTLTATLPLVLNALAGRGTHLVTVNDYLARRDAEWMGKIYRYLGLTVGVIQHDLSREQRQQSYGCDITYITNHEIGFDYLRDHSSAWRPEHLVIRELHYAIIDEVDSILIDEARVPLIISASRGKPVEKYRKIQEVVARLVEGEQDLETKETTGDFYVDEKAKNATITEDGQRKVEIGLGIDNLNDSAQIEEMHLVNAALKANYCYKRDVDYIVGPGDGGVPSVIIVDSFTGRPQPGRRWSDGLHQAIEAKERVPVQDEQQTIATVTYQNFFLMYHRLSGMTGTAKTEEAEFVGIYEMPVVVVPTNRPLRRLEHSDVVYKSEEWKFRGICTEIAQYFMRRQPVLVGTRSVSTSEQVSARLKPDMMRMTLQLLLLQWHIMEHEKKLNKDLLRDLRERSTVPLESLKPREVADFLTRLELDPTLDSEANLATLKTVLEVSDEQAIRDVIKHGVPHEVLNARHHEREAQIVAQAGRLGAVTIATNMAGRGTDIVLGGNPEPDVEDLLSGRGVDPKSLEATLFINQALKGETAEAEAMAASHGGLPEPVLAEIAAIRTAWRAEQEDVLAVGGLHILGTERHESRRIDNQLRGRSGRQGDPGASRFYISLQDELMRLFGPDRWSLLMNQWPEEQPVEAKLISRAMNNAQKKVEGRNFEIRKNTLRYDDVMNVQRLHIYSERRRILEGVDLRATVSHMMGDLVDEVLAIHAPAEMEPSEWDLPAIWGTLNQRFPLKDQLSFEDLAGLDRELLGERLRAAAERAYDDKENDFIRAVVEFELRASVHETLEQLSDRETVCGVLNTLWPLTDYLPTRLAGIPDTRVPETLFHVVREALETGPRAFILAVIRDRLSQDAAIAAAELADGVPSAEVLSDLLSAWPVELAEAHLAAGEDGAAKLAKRLHDTLDRLGWDFATRALQRQMAATVERRLPAHCDLPTVLDSLQARWPLGDGLQVADLAEHNYGVIDDRLRRTIDDTIATHGYDYLAHAADHRLRHAAALAGADSGTLSQLLRELLPQGTVPDLTALETQPERLVSVLLDDAIDGLILQAMEAVAVQAAIDAHRHMSVGAEDSEDEEELVFGDLQRLVERYGEQWAIGEALNPWELERLPAAAVRPELADAVRTEIRTRQMSFVNATAELRFERLIRAAVLDHYSLEGIASRLNQALELPGVFRAEDFAEATNGAELIELLSATAADQLDDEETEQFGAWQKTIQTTVQEGYNLKRLSDRLNQELSLVPPLTPAELAESPLGSMSEHLLERLAPSAETFTQEFILDAVQQQMHLDLETVLDRHYDLRAVSRELAAAWPLRPDAVRSSKLKGWSYNELAKRLTELLNEAYRNEEWRFTRRFALRLLEQGLEEVVAIHCPAEMPPSAWDLEAVCAELAERWPLAEPPQPGELRGMPRALLIDHLLGRAREGYGLEERAFLRETARHRFGQQLEQMRREHYSLGRAAQAINWHWQLRDGALSPLSLAPLREAKSEEQRRAAVAGLVETALPEALAAFDKQTVQRRLTDSVDDVLRRHYNLSQLLDRLFGEWPLNQGGLRPATLRALPYRDLVDRLRQLLAGATGPLQRRLVFHNLRQVVAELPLAELTAGAAADWRPGAIVDALAERLPELGRLEPGQVVAALLDAATAKSRRRAIAAVTPSQREAVVTVLLERTRRAVEDLLAVERRPQALVDRLAEQWPIESALSGAQLKGQTVKQVQSALIEALAQEIQKDPTAFLQATATRWLARTVESALDEHWPADRQPGPWVLAKVVETLNARWQRPELLHPTSYKGLDREQLREELQAVIASLAASGIEAVTLSELTEAHLRAVLEEAAAAALRPDGGWELDRLVQALAERWPSGTAPTVAELGEAMQPDLVREQLLRLVVRSERRLVTEFNSEAVQGWLTERLDRALAQFCSLTAVCDELSRRWPLEELDPSRLATGSYRQIRDGLIEQSTAVAQTGEEPFVLEAARRRLTSDIDSIVEQIQTQGGTSEIGAETIRQALERWPWRIDQSALQGLRADEARARLTEAGTDLDDAALLRTFRFETTRRRLRQAVDEAQKEHANPEIAADRWDVPAFVAALERDWPIAGQLAVDTLQSLPAPALNEAARAVLLKAFEADEISFIESTTRQQLGHGIVAAVREHATLESLATVLTEAWPRDGAFETEELRAARTDELIEELVVLLAGPDHPDLERLRGEIEAFMQPYLTGELDLPAVLAAAAQRWPSLPPMTAAELDERLIREHLQNRLWAEFEEDPRAFVKAVALEDVPRQLERRLMLEAIDTNWCNHLEAMDYLREGINLRGYAQTDPFLAYRKEGRTMFENMLGRVRETVVAGLFETTEHQLVEMHRHGRLGLRIAVEFQNIQEMAAKAEELTGSHAGGDAAGSAPPPASPAASAAPQRQSAAGGAATATATKAPVVVEKVGRNDPCPCGSGKKYKHCCGRGR